ncbi:MAG: major facilitator superfamily 1 [Deltaproteobacteria bacterium]|nr:major facilitator superfamily 1 [Deltaproteobacteria bacterium]
MIDSRKTNSWLLITLAAAAMLMITMGARQAQGLFVFPISGSTGVSIVTISFAMAVGQFMWGLAQPVAGACADRFGFAPVLIGGVLLLAVGTALTPFFTTSSGFVVTIGILSAMGSGAGSFSVMIGALARRLAPSERATASGLITGGGSFGQFLFAPIIQKMISLWGWTGAMWSLSAITLLALPLVKSIAGPAGHGGALASTSRDGGMRAALRTALGNSSYWLLHGSFLTCGFHIAFLITHLPGEVDLCGLPASVASWSLAIIGLANIAGSFTAGWLLNHIRGKYILFGMYGSRTLLILLYLAAPKTEWTFYLMALGLGFSWLGTAPPTAGVVGKLFGIRYLATLYGLTMLSHQIGGFFGAWLGGLTFSYYGNYLWMWYADALFAAIAALLNLPIREPWLEPRAVPA